VSGSRIDFIDGAMTPIVEAVLEVGRLIDRRPTVVGGLAVMSRLQIPYRATVDLDVVDRGLGTESQLEVLLKADGAERKDPSAVMVPTPSGAVKVDVLEVNQAEIDTPSDNVGDRLFATSHAWAYDSATELVIGVIAKGGHLVIETAALVAEPGPLVAMKLQAIMNRMNGKEGTDLLDIVRLTLDPTAGPVVRAQIGARDAQTRYDIAEHVTGWFDTKAGWSLDRIHRAAGADVTRDDLDLVRELLLQATGSDG